MKGNFLFGFILLATLSMVNATTNFGKCPVTDPIVPTLLSVTLTPDPIAKDKTFDVAFSGTLAADATEDKQTIAEVAFLRNDAPVDPDYTQVDFCTLEGIKCPLKAGTQFSTSIKAIKVPDAVANGDKLVVDVFHVDSFYGCAYSDGLTF